MNQENKKSIFLSVGAAVFVAGLVFLAILALTFLGGGQGEPVNTPQPTAGDPVGTIASNDIPPALLETFKQASAATGVPVALIAAISTTECTGFWGKDYKVPARKQAWYTQIEDWINRNADVDIERACSKPHKQNAGYVWGPMQFLDTTWGMAKFTSSINPHPALRAGSSKESPSIGYQAGQKTSHQPASVLNIKDVAYGAAILLDINRQHAVKQGGTLAGHSGWDEAVIIDAARRYCNGDKNNNPQSSNYDLIIPKICAVQINGTWMGYGHGVYMRYKTLGGI